MLGFVDILIVALSVLFAILGGSSCLNWLRAQKKAFF